MISMVSDMGIWGEDAILLFYSIEMRIQLFFKILLIRSNKDSIYSLHSSCFEDFGTGIGRRSCRYDVVDEYSDLREDDS